MGDQPQDLTALDDAALDDLFERTLEARVDRRTRCGPTSCSTRSRTSSSTAGSEGVRGRVSQQSRGVVTDTDAPSVELSADGKTPLWDRTPGGQYRYVSEQDRGFRLAYGLRAPRGEGGDTAQAEGPARKPHWHRGGIGRRGRGGP